ncbi:MAG: hypothetical protein IKI84_08410 [Clostridia bacterium]|nr:hypothetical protein [Clostridia bacterium]
MKKTEDRRKPARRFSVFFRFKADRDVESLFSFFASRLILILFKKSKSIFIAPKARSGSDGMMRFARQRKA